MPATPAADLPLKRVVLFTAGVGYFRNEGTVRVTLRAPEENVNDLIKTPTATDLDGGTVRVITLDNRVPSEVTLKAFPAPRGVTSGS